MPPCLSVKDRAEGAEASSVPVAYEDKGGVAGVEMVHNSNDVIAQGLQPTDTCRQAQRSSLFPLWNQACGRGRKGRTLQYSAKVQESPVQFCT